MTDFTDYCYGTKFSVLFTLRTPLLLGSGYEGDFTDSTLDKTPDGTQLHINGYVWASLLRRALERLKPYQEFASEVGKYENPEQKGVSPFWFESSFVPLKAVDIRPGIRIDRKYGVTVQGALYHDEYASAGHKLSMNFTYFHKDMEDLDKFSRALSDALYVVEEGIENIGGGWSYGYGRLKVEEVIYQTLNLREKKDRELLWNDASLHSKAQKLEIVRERPKSEISKKWIKYTVKAKVAPGQLLAIHSNYFPSLHGLPKEIASLKHLPDAFVQRRYSLQDGTTTTDIVIPGKAIRQALFSVPIERKLRTRGSPICLTPSEYCTCPRCESQRQNDKNLVRAEDCECLRCKWFGSTESGGIMAVTEAVVKNPETVILNRIQLCEHSMQNINLFSEEYLKKGEFEFKVLIDCSRDDTEYEALIEEVEWLLSEIKESAPPGWYRIGANSTATGQISVEEFKKMG